MQILLNHYTKNFSHPKQKKSNFLPDFFLIADQVYTTYIQVESITPCLALQSICLHLEQNQHMQLLEFFPLFLCSKQFLRRRKKEHQSLEWIPSPKGLLESFELKKFEKEQKEL